MKYIKQFAIILVISFIGKALNRLVPLPIPGSIYGLALLFLCLQFKVIALKDVHETSSFLVEIMPLLFIPAAVGMMSTWHILKPVLLPFSTIIVISTLCVMVVTGRVTQWIIKKQHKEA